MVPDAQSQQFKTIILFLHILRSLTLNHVSLRVGAVPWLSPKRMNLTELNSSSATGANFNFNSVSIVNGPDAWPVLACQIVAIIENES